MFTNFSVLCKQFDVSKALLPEANTASQICENYWTCLA